MIAALAACGPNPASRCMQIGLRDAGDLSLVQDGSEADLMLLALHANRVA